MRKHRSTSNEPTNLVETGQASVIFLLEPCSFGMSRQSIQQNFIQLMVSQALLVSYLWLFLFSRAVWFLVLGLFPSRLRIYICVGADALIHCTTTWKTNRRARLPANPSQRYCLRPFTPDTVTLGSEHMGKSFLQSHLWPIYKIYCTFVEKKKMCSWTAWEIDGFTNREKYTQASYEALVSVPHSAARFWMTSPALRLHNTNKCLHPFEVNYLWIF